MNIALRTKTKWIPTLSLVYLAIPVLLFLSFWIKPLVSVPLIALILYSLFRTYQNTNPFQLEKPSAKGKVVWILAILFVWVLLSGIGGFVWQNRWDHMFRNALFQDLVKYDWPVIDTSLGSTRLLCYNFGFWLPSALIGKALGMQAGYVFQLIWAFFGVALAFALLCERLGKVSMTALILFLVFSGLDIVLFFLGKIHSHELNTALGELLQGTHLELKLYQFSSASNTTLLFWVYNQIIPFWVAFLLLLRETSNRSRLFVFMLMLLYSPFPAVGTLPLLVYQFFQKSNFEGLTRADRMRSFLRNTVTIPNLTGFVVCLLISLFYMSNIATGSVGLIPLNTGSLMEFGLYFSTEFLVFLVFILLDRKSDPVYWILLGSMIVFSFITLGNNYDFGWRTCIPAAFYTMLLIAKILTEPAPKRKLLRIALIAVLVIGSVTPAMEVLRTVENTTAVCTGVSTEPLMSDSLDSVFDQANNKCYDNFIGVSDSVFAEYFLAK
ncbi:MAG: hypothetical protein PHW41_01725 [Eubacteriales bacterium]|nr:hypothetical protein [Eubacteriales bacterium]